MSDYKIALISDIHFGVKNNNETYIKIMEEFFTGTLPKALVKENVKDVRILGDIFDNRNTINVRALNSVLKIFDFYKDNHPDVTFRILLGNHDVYFHNRIDINSLEALRKFPNVVLIDKITTELLSNKTVISVPWFTPESDIGHEFESVLHGEKKYDLCLGHFEINGFEVVPGVVHQTGNDIEKFKNFKRVFSGHFHIRGTKGQISYLGCPYPLTWSDYGNTKGIHIYNVTTGETTFIENTVSPKFIKVDIDDYFTKNLEKLKQVKGNTVRVSINKEYSEKDILKALSMFDAMKPLKLEVENNFIKSVEDLPDNVNLDKLSDPFSITVEYINNIEDSTLKDVSKADLIESLRLLMVKANK